MNSFQKNIPFDAERILAGITDAFIALDTDWRFTYLNDQAERVVFQKREEVLGRCFWEVFPEAVGSAFERQYRRAVGEGVPVTFEEFFPPLDTWFEVRAYPSSDGLSIFFQNVNERRQTQEALRASDAALHESGERLRDTQMRLEAALSAGGIATWTWDVQNDRVVADANLARLFAVSLEDAAGGEIGVYLQAIHPEDRPRVAQAIGEAVAHGRQYEAEYRVVLPDGSHRWLATRGRVERNADGRAVALPGVVQDITEQAERGRRERFLAELTERARRMTDPEEVIADAVRSVGGFLGVSRCVFADIDIAADACTIPRDYCADETVTSMAGTFPISAFGPFLVGEYDAGRTVAVDDVRADPVRVPPGFVGAYDAVACRAFVAAPVPRTARLVSVLAVHHPTPRRWKPEEVELVQTVAARTWLTVEVIRQQRALAREAREQRARAEREALLNRVGLAIRSTPDPEAVQVAAIALVGEALGADRCYFAVYDLTRGVVGIAHDWHREGLPSVQGVYPFTNTVEMFRELYHGSNTSVVTDAHTAPLSAQTRANMESLQLRSRISVALVDGEGLMATLTAAMSDGPREWTAEEVSLVEAVGTQLRTAVEAARVTRREHNIAEQLQAALQPPLPQGVAGLKLAKHYEAALEEAGVGGDFYDVFPVEKGCTALVVGDLSGKGLAAAAQVSVVRNMLRAFLYSKPTLAEAVTDLNRVLVLNDLLTGFATLWVGCYDAAAGDLAYVNLGQEAPLLRRAATGEVERLLSTGPVLGMDANAHYEERAVALSPGDALAVFTDGATECGPSRREMLGIDGVAALLSPPFAPADGESAARMADAVMRRLVAGVNAASRGGVAKDDLCVLVAVVEAGPRSGGV